jgi:enoyl-CoA hydratase/carnithine racemase
MSGFETLIVERQDHIVHVTLNRPKTLNAHNVQMRDDLFEVLTAASMDEDIRVMIFTGAGEKAFCAGADLSEFLTSPPPSAAREVRFDRDLWGLFTRMPQILIAAVHGYVLGSGIEIALCCDICIASDDARFGLPEMGLGMIPAAGGTQTVPRASCAGKALEMILTNRWINAADAFRARFVNHVVSGNRLFAAALEMAEKIVAKDWDAVKFAKQAATRGMDLPLAGGLALEKRLASILTFKQKTG